jgi:hypothetical protein
MRPRENCGERVPIHWKIVPIFRNIRNMRGYHAAIAPVVGHGLTIAIFINFDPLMH